MAKKKKIRFLFLEYSILLILEWIISILPRFLTLRIGAFLGICLYYSGAYRKIVRRNMEYAGYWDNPQMKQITKRLYKNIGRYTSDFLRKDNPPYRINNNEIIPHLSKQGKGIVAILAHFGNWEILASIFGPHIDGLHVVAKPMKNKWVDTWLANKRSKASVTTIYARQAFRKMYSVIRKNGMVALLIDQYAGRNGTMVPFLGKEANTVRAVAVLVHKTDCAVLSAYALMNNRGVYNVMFSHVVPVKSNGMDDNETISAYQRQHNKIIEEWIKAHPDHWFGWFHRRFRASIRYDR